MKGCAIQLLTMLLPFAVLNMAGSASLENIDADSLQHGTIGVLVAVDQDGPCLYWHHQPNISESFVGNCQWSLLVCQSLFLSTASGNHPIHESPLSQCGSTGSDFEDRDGGVDRIDSKSTATRRLNEDGGGVTF